MTRKLSRPQIDALRYVSGRQLYADAVNGGNGNLRRTILSLLKLGMLDWDPIYRGRVVVTASGEEQLQRVRERERAAKAKLGKITKEVRS